MYACLNIYPMSKGHALIMPKEHAEVLGDGSKEAAMRLMETLYKIAPAIMKALGADGYNLGMNHGACAGQLVFHTHLHLMPRWDGVERTFEKMESSQEELAEVAEMIRKETNAL